MSLAIVVSTGRCGSTLLSRILHRNPETLSISEFFATLAVAADNQGIPTQEMDGEELWRLLSSTESIFGAVLRAGWKVPELCYPFETGRYDREGGVPAICNLTLPMLTDDPDSLYDKMAEEVSAYPKRPASEHYLALFGWLSETLGRPTIVERSANSMMFVPALREMFPDARFVHMYRSGPDCALSMSRHPMFRHGVLTMGAFMSMDPPAASWEEFERRMPPELDGLVKPPFDGNRIMEHEIPVSAFGDMWSGMVAGGLSSLTGLPADQWMSLEYEELLTDPQAELSRLAGFLGIPASQEWFDEARTMIDFSRVGAASKLDPGELAALEAACKPGSDMIASLVR
ncbi:MAG: sulfotransferase family protein [Spirillospora sp.]